VSEPRKRPTGIMIALVLLAATFGMLEAMPAGPALFPSFSSMVIGGVDASRGEFPWQLSQQRQGSGGAWSHSCGASLLSSTRALSAAHCVDGAAVNIIRVIAGLHDRSNTAGTQTSNAARLVLHTGYNNGQWTFANDIAIIHLATAISTGSGIAFATLPANNNNNFAGTTCVISGWGRTSSSNTLPDTLQKASIGVITTAQCNTELKGVGTAHDNHICLFDTANRIGSCNGDSGGPLNCPSGTSTVVAGVTSWGVSTALGNCLQTYPSVYTRTSAYLTWISGN
jgi:secreted trypsin-like serine protease